MEQAPQSGLNPPPAVSDRSWDIFCHLSAAAGLFIPFGNVLGPLVIWLLKRDVLPSVNAHGKEALNFQISMAIYTIIAAISILAIVGIVLLPVVVLLDIVFMIVASVKAGNGELYRYPLSIRFIR